jgi:hypothetical protein
MTYEQFELPNQRMPESKWTKKLYLEHANKMIEYIGNDVFTRRNDSISKYYRRYSCELSPKEVQANDSLTKQYGFDLGVEYMIYPLCEMVVDQLVSEYISVPMRKKLYSINKSAINSKLDEKVKYINEEIFRAENEKLENELGFIPETEDPDIDLPDDIEEFFAKDYKTQAEEIGDDIIEQFLEVLKEKRKVKTLLQDYLISEQVIATIEEKDGHPTIRRAKYDECYIDVNPDEEIQNDINIFAYFPYYTKNEILNKYNLDTEQLKTLDEIFAKMESGKLTNEPFDFGRNNGVDSVGFNNSKSGVSYRNWYDTNSRNRIRVMKMQWKSRKEIRAKVHTNQHTGEEIYTLIGKDEKPRARDVIKKTTIEVIREVEMIGPELVLKYGECKERLSFIDNKKKVMLPVVSLIGRNTMYTGEIRSVVAKIEPLQKMASDLLFELRLAMKANDGRILVYDTAQTPKQFLDQGPGKALNRVLHHIKKDKMLLFNSKDHKSRATFNQFTALDLSNRGQVKDIMDALMLMEDLGRKFVGLSKERQGEVGQYQTKGGTDRAVQASNARTEVYFNPFDEFLQDLLGRMLIKSKSIYKSGQVFQYIFGDLKTKFLTVFQEYFNSDLGIYFGNRFKDQKDKQIIDGAAQQALSNASDKELILDLINVLQGESASESKAILEKGLSTFQKLQAENAKAAQAAEEAKMAHEMAIEDKIDERGREKNINNIEVAQIYADNKTFNDTQKINSQEVQTLAKLSVDQLKAEKDSIAKEKKSE